MALGHPKALFVLKQKNKVSEKKTSIQVSLNFLVSFLLKKTSTISSVLVKSHRTYTPRTYTPRRTLKKILSLQI